MPDVLVRDAHRTEVERVYREEGAGLWRAVLLFSNDPEIASDAVAEAFAQALRRGDAIRELQGWVWKASFRIAAGELKERRRRTDVVPEFHYEMPEPAEEIRAALAQLSPMQRGAVILFYIADYPIREVARILGSTAGAVQVHLVRARKRLRTLLEDEDG